MPEKSLALTLIEEAIKNQSKTLDLGNCGLTDESPELKLLAECSFLEVLNLGRFYCIEHGKVEGTKNHGNLNKLGKIPASLPNRLYSLSFSDNNISKIENLERLFNLRILYLNRNKIKKTENLKNLSKLIILYLLNNQITKIENLDNLTMLRQLKLGSNQITKIENLEKLISITELSLSGNQITKIENLDTLTNLIHLDLYENQIAKIENLNILANLSKVYLDDNQIAKIENLDKLTKLRDLYLGKNKISKIENLDKLNNLHVLRLSNNPVRNFPQSLVNTEDCWAYCKDWINELNKTPNDLYTNRQGKLLLLGNGNVGKSSFLDALKYGKCTEDKKTTHAVQLHPWENTHIDYTFQVWDFGGQELFFGTHKLFMQGQSIIAILFDPDTEKETIVPDRSRSQDLTRNKRVKHWIEIAKKESPNSPIMVIQTKKNEQPNISNNIEEYCLSQKIKFIHVDSRTGANIDEAIFYIEKYTKENLYEYHMQMPRTWDNVRRHFFNIQQKENPDKFYFTIDDFYSLCKEYGIESEIHASVLEYLFNAGIVYRNAKFLPNTVIYDIRWLLGAIYLPFKRDSPFFNILKDYSRGFIKYRELKTEWAKVYKVENFPMFLSFMQSCSICFVLNGYSYKTEILEEDYLVFPEFLSIEKPPFIEKILDPNLKTIEVEFDYLPTYIIQRFIAKYGNYTSINNYWYNGLLIDNKEFLYIESDLERHKLILKFKPSASEEWIKEIKSELPTHLIKEEKELTKFNTLQVAVEKDDFESKESTSKTDLTPIKNNPPLKIAISYAAEDYEECKTLYENLTILEADNKIRLFYDKNIDENNWDEQIRKEFHDCDLIIILNSADYNKPNKKYIWNVEIPIIEEKLTHQGSLNVIRINLSKCNSRDLVANINDHKMGTVPIEKYAKQEFYKRITDEIIINKIIHPQAEKGK